MIHMKNKLKADPFLRIFIFAAAFAAIAAAAAALLYYYIFGISEPEGLSRAVWPHMFTENFSVWMDDQDGRLVIEDIALERLDEYGLWIQVLDESGKEIFSHNKPAGRPAAYPASELTAFATSAYENGSTVFVGRFEGAGQTWSYLIGFPYAIGKYMLYYNGENVGRLSPVFRMGIGAALVLFLAFLLAYGFWLTSHLAKISKGISSISQRTYAPLPEKGMFHGVYKELNHMDTQIRAGDRLRNETDRTRREWISNITHDLKTPLSPVKGYAEMLSDGAVVESGLVQEYGKIILKNACYAETLINDLKLTYQLESGVTPFHPKRIRFVRYLREIVIDLINDPAFSGRSIELYSDMDEILVYVDTELFRRAISNLIVNALTHNPPETEVKVKVSTDRQNQIAVTIQDNGTGMSAKEQAEVFERYYRGTNTKEKPEGSGLGLAIAKQIVVMHGGDIFVKSGEELGTEFMIWLPNIPFDLRQN